MEQDTRAEIDRLHERVNGVTDRVTILETQSPYIKEALARIEKSVDRLNAHVAKAIWAVVILFIGLVFKFTVEGGWTVVTSAG